MTSRPRRSTVLLAAAIALAIVVAVLLLRTGGSPSRTTATGPPTALSSSAASLAQGQARAARFADTFAGFLNGTRDASDLTDAGASDQVIRSITATPDRRAPGDPRSHYTAQDVQVVPRGPTLQLTATLVDGDLRVPLLVTLSRVAGNWQVTNFFASQD